MTTRLFKRKARLVVGEFDVTNLRFGFNVEKHLRKEPNSAKITVYNMSEDKRKSLEGDKKQIPVQLEAGYEDETFLIFLGFLDSARSERQGADWVTTIYSDDGRKASRARSGISFKAGASYKKAAEDLAQKMDVGLGNLIEKIGTALNLDFLGNKSDSGLVPKGKAQDALEKILNASGFTHSVQDGEIEVRELNKPLFPATEAVTLNRSSGLVDTPSIDKKGRIEARALMINGLSPGHAVKVESNTANGIWLIDSVLFSGDTHGSDWYAEIEGRPLT